MNNNKPICFLHLGVSQTGSTALQTFLANNMQLLEANNILYPIPDGNPINRRAWIGNSYTLAKSLRDGSYAPHTVRDNVSRMADQASVSNKNILLSCEAFAEIRKLDTVKFFCDLLTMYFTLVVIGVVRDPLSWFFSRWKQSLKIEKEYDKFCPFPDFLKTYPVQLAHASIWLSYASEAHLYSYEEHKNDLLSPFLAALRISLPEAQGSGSLANKLSLVNRTLSDSEMAFLMAYDKTPALQGHGALRLKILQAFMSSGKKMEEMSFCSPDPALAELAEARHEEFFQALEPYLPRERIIHPIRATGPIMNDDTFKIDPADMSLALKVIEEYFKNRN